MGNSAIGGVFRAKGILSAEAQKLVRMHCERGNAQAMIEAVAEFLVSNGIVRGRIPPNAGEKRKDLLERAEQAMYREAEEYHSKGGVLVAKGYVSITGLVAEMAKHWLREFSPPIPTEFSLKGTLSDPEIQDRLTVVALKLLEILNEYNEIVEHEAGVSAQKIGTIIIPHDKVEGFCRRAAIEMFRAFEHPNETNHEIIHKEKR
jgi:hypothetical protein